MLTIIYWSLAASLFINIAMFLIAYRLRSDQVTDASYAASFIALALFFYIQSQKGVYDAVIVGMVCIWALRIGGFLLYRVLHAGKDRRFDGIRENFWLFGKFWLGQAITVWVLMIPVALTVSSHSSSGGMPFIGAIIWLIGFGIESIADLQKYRFTHTAANKNRWIDSGIWHYSRHPNYFGEMLVWVGIYFYCFQPLSFEGRIIGAVSPLLIMTLLLFVSGVPLLEKEADKRWGSDRAYRLYKKNTSLLIPLPKGKLH